jgi:hypothetical protein
MATLVQFLAAGVKGAESGSAVFTLRGTASSAASVLYSDFEGTTQPGTNTITLDANGAAEVYCDAYCDVALKTSAGVTLRTVTIGNSGGLVEVKSDSFTGTDYDGSPANTVSNPITLNAVLDKWNDSAGTTNWKVLVGGIATNLSSAIAAFSGLFTNVKDPAYGAVGDGVTDDTTAILAATTAAAGGIVLFPPGTYKVTTLNLTGANINWLGCGDGAAIISGTTSTQLISLTDNTATAYKNFKGLSFTSSGTYSRLFALEESQNVSFDTCFFDGSNCTGDIAFGGTASGLAQYRFLNCDFKLAASGMRGLYNNAARGLRSVSLRGCTFKLPAGFTGSVLVGANFMVTGCRFDGTLVTSGAYYHIDAEDANAAGAYVGSFVGNQFIDGGSSGFAFKLTGVKTNSEFTENSNNFSGYTDPLISAVGRLYDYTNDAAIAESSRIVLGSRLGKSLRYTNSAASNTEIVPIKVAETVVINHTFAGDSNINLTASAVPVPMPPNSEVTIAVFNNSGGSRNVAFNDSNTTTTLSTVAAGGMAAARYKYFLETTGTMRSVLLGTYQAGT